LALAEKEDNKAKKAPVAEAPKAEVKKEAPKAD